MKLLFLSCSVFFISYLSLTAQTIELVKDIRPGGHSFPSNYFAFKDKILFSAWNEEYGREVWVSDGTEVGTKVLKDIAPGSSSSSYHYFMGEFDGKVFFTGKDTIHGKELWISDGTSVGTYLFADFNPGKADSDFSNMIELNGKIFFLANGFLWSTEGQPENIVKIKEGVYNFFIPLTVAGNNFFFDGKDENFDRELWISNGTAEGTHLLKDIEPGSLPSWPQIKISHKNKIYFSTKIYPSNGFKKREFYISDGTFEGTQTAQSLISGPEFVSYRPQSSIVFQDKVHFIGYDTLTQTGGIYRTDGTSEGTDLHPFDFYNEQGWTTGNFTLFRDKLVFTAWDSLHGTELWITDGTTAGTHMIVDLNEGELDSHPRHLVEFKGRLYFFAGTGGLASHGNCDMWVTDGTAKGTVKVVHPPLNPQLGLTGFCPYYFSGGGELNLCFEGYGKTKDALYFTAHYGETGCELYKLTAPPLINFQNSCGNLKYQLYPNPAAETVNLALESEELTDLKIRVFDVTGRDLGSWFETKNLTSGFNEISMNIPSNMQSGIYFLQLENEQCREVVKLNISK